MADKTAELIARALLKERARNGRRIAAIRLLGVSSVFGLALYYGLAAGLPDWRGTVPGFFGYWLLSAGLAAVVWRWRATAFVSGLGLVLVDVPMVFWIQQRSLPTSPSAQGTASFALAIFCALEALAALSLERKVAAGVALIGGAFE